MSKPLRYKFKIGIMVKSKRYLYVIVSRGVIPRTETKGYEMLNVNTKARYWISAKEAHGRYRFFSDTKAAMVLYA